MAIIRPFKALRPREDAYAKVASVPYDVVNAEEARALAKGNPLSFLHVARAEIDLSEDVDPYDARVYEKARDNFHRLIKSGVLKFDPQEHLYLYSQKMGDHFQAGLVALASVDEYDGNVIRKHEKTRKDKEDDRTRAIVALSAHSEPVFLTYRHDGRVDAVVDRIIRTQPPVNRFTAGDDIEHKVWVVADEKDARELVAAFGGIPLLYIADGHHRSASASRAREHFKGKNPDHDGHEAYNFFLSVLFPDNQLSVMPYNRVVRDLNGMTKEAFLREAAKRFDIVRDNRPAPSGPRQFSLYLDGSWTTLSVRDADFPASDPIHSLDVSLLQELLLAPLLNIQDPRTDKRIEFIGGIRGTGELEKLVDSGEFAAAFSLYPVRVEQIMAIADAGGIMPPKSTWFEPKLRSGLIIHPF